MSERQVGDPSARGASCPSTPATSGHPARPLVAVGAVLAGTVLVAGVGASVADRPTPDQVAAANTPSPVATTIQGVDVQTTSAAVAAAGGGVVTAADPGPAGGWLVTVRWADEVAYVLTDASRAVRSVRVESQA